MQKTELERAVFRHSSGHPSLSTMLFFQAQYQWGQVLGPFDCVLEGLKGTFHMYWKSSLYRCPVITAHNVVP
jgi:hypothetical protein